MQKTINTMIKKLFIFSVIYFNINLSFAQDIYAFKSGKVNFFAGTPMEDIDATNSKLTSFINLKTGEAVISMFNTDFKFSSSLMQEHFNENYMESEKFPKSEFKGKIQNIETIDLTKSGEYKVKIEGIFTIHGVSKSNIVDAIIVNKNGKIQVDSKFSIALADFKIERPQIVWEKLAENVQITLSLNYEAFKK
ncbi:MAG: YceI family protein [Bacteroidota bacterium]|nr:YceI family protein [Bacteroidota bacterium]